MKHLFLALFLCVALPATAADNASRMSEITRIYSKSLAIVRDDTGLKSGGASAFIARYGKGRYLFTNQHVVAGIMQPAFILPDQTRVKVGSAAAAFEHDIMTYGLEPAEGGLEVMVGVDQGVSIGDDIAVLGNPDAAGVIHPLMGKILGLGPRLVEISAEIVPGNSGSPVIHLQTGKVLAVVSYLTYEKADFKKGRMVDQVRRFCYRIDSIKRWEPVRWGDYHDESDTVANVRRRTLETSMLLLDPENLRHMNPDVLKDADLQAAVRKFQRSFAASTTPAERISAANAFIQHLRRSCVSDIEHARRRISYDYFTKTLLAEELHRRPIPAVLDAVIEYLRVRPKESEANR